MLLAELERDAPDLIAVLRRRAAGWYLRNGWPEEALEYSMAAGDVDTVGWLWWRYSWCRPTGKDGSRPFERWLRWLEGRAGIGGHPMVAAGGASLGVDGAASGGRAVDGRGGTLAVR